MYLFTLLATLLSACTLLPMARAGPSGTPTAYTCPTTNEAGVVLGPTAISSADLFCSYPPTPDADPNNAYCGYSRTTGAKVLDVDAGLCPGSAPLAGGVANERRRNVHPPLPTRPQNVIRGVKDSSTRRNYLKKRRVSAENAL